MKLSRTAVVLVVCIALATMRTTAQEWEVVRLSVGDGVESLPAIVAQERGFFLQERLVASTLSIVSHEALAISLAAGTTDFAVVPQRSLLLMAAGRMPVTVVATSNWDMARELIVPSANDWFEDTSSLRGRRVAVDDGSDSLAVLIRLLNQGEAPLSEVTVQSLPAAQLAEAFGDGRVDAVLAPRHVTQPLVEKGEAVAALDHRSLVGRLGIIGAQPVVVRDELLSRDPATVQRFVNAWIKALVYVNQEPDDAARLLQVFLHRQGVRISAEDARARLAMTRFDRYDWSGRDAIEASYMGWALREARMFEAVPSLRGYVNASFSEQAWRGLQRQ